ncbi:TIGR01244 family sulfur transferase [Oceaniglobus indicus]|uniref:TIGR01244 family sulfur transferase n=1 Tax=Oceaniglobus indicus TaxID=2047749 RepID=UPI0030C74BC3
MNALTPAYTVSGQITPDDIPTLKEAGFTAVICNRPDDEVTPDEDHAAIRAAAEAAGLTFVYNPVVNGALHAGNIRAQGDAIAAASGPVFAYCRSGMRSSVVWALSQAPHTPADDLIAAARQAGYALDGLRPQIEAAAKA